MELSTIWRRPAYLPYVQPALTMSMVKEAEKKLGHKLPPELIEILKIQNGGYLRMEVKNHPFSMILGIGPYAPSLTTLIWEKEGLIPFDGDGHWNLCLDYRTNINSPCITYVSQEGEGKEKKIANSFKDYLGMLTLRTYGQYVLDSDIVPDVMIPKIEKELNIKFDPLTKWPNGIPNNRTKYKNSWITINSNMVPTGYIRKKDKRYAELRPTIKGFVKLYDELKENTYLIKIFKEEEEREVFEMLSKAGLLLQKIDILIEERNRNDG